LPISVLEIALRNNAVLWFPASSIFFSLPLSGISSLAQTSGLNLGLRRWDIRQRHSEQWIGVVHTFEIV
jgi:hypothetical protein